MPPSGARWPIRVSPDYMHPMHIVRTICDHYMGLAYYMAYSLTSVV
jgi:hypothetical protein